MVSCSGDGRDKSGRNGCRGWGRMYGRLGVDTELAGTGGDGDECTSACSSLYCPEVQLSKDSSCIA